MSESEPRQGAQCAPLFIGIIQGNGAMDVMDTNFVRNIEKPGDAAFQKIVNHEDWDVNDFWNAVELMCTNYVVSIIFEQDLDPDSVIAESTINDADDVKDTKVLSLYFTTERGQDVECHWAIPSVLYANVTMEIIMWFDRMEYIEANDVKLRQIKDLSDKEIAIVKMQWRNPMQQLEEKTDLH